MMIIQSLISFIAQSLPIYAINLIAFSRMHTTYNMKIFKERRPLW